MPSSWAPRTSVDAWYNLPGSPPYLPPAHKTASYVDASSSSLGQIYEAVVNDDVNGGARPTLGRAPSNETVNGNVRTPGPETEADRVLRIGNSEKHPIIENVRAGRRIRSQAAEIDTMFASSPSTPNEDVSLDDDEDRHEPYSPHLQKSSFNAEESGTSNRSIQSTGSGERLAVSGSSTTSTRETSNRFETASTPSKSKSSNACRRCSAGFKCARWFASVSKWWTSPSSYSRRKRSPCKECALWFASTSYRCSDQSCEWNARLPS